MILAFVLFTLRSASVAVAAFSGLEPLDFAGRPAVTAPYFARGLVAGRFDQDKRSDVAAIAAAAGVVRVFLGDARGRLLPNGQELRTGADPTAIAAGDVDGDRISDLVVADGKGKRLAVYLGGGTGTFSVGVDLALDYEADDVDLSDADNDGRIDLFVSCGKERRIGFVRGEGQGRFGPVEWLVLDFNPSRLTIVDLDRDGNDDLVAGIQDDDDLAVMLGDGLGRFERVANIAGSGIGYATSAGDLDDDGIADLVVSVRETPRVGVDVHLGDGAGGARETRHVPTVSTPQALSLADLDGDGRQDVLFVAGYPSRVVVLLGDGTGGFAPETYALVPDRAARLVTGDFDGDSLTDAAVYDSGLIVNLAGDGRGGFQPAAAQSPTVTRSGALAAGDLDGDGRAEMFLNEFGLTQFLVYRPDGAGSPALAAEIDSASSRWRPTPADYDGDGDLDVAIAAASPAGLLSIFGGDGRGGLGLERTVAAGADVSAIVPADLDGDGNLDLVCGLRLSAFVAVLRGDGTGDFVLWVRLPIPHFSRSIAVADFGGDGTPDIAVGDYSGIAILDGRGSFSFSLPREIPIEGQPDSLTPLDIDGDGAHEIAYSLFSRSGLGILSESGRENRRYDAGRNPSAFSAADFDGDGRFDLAVVQDLDSFVTILRGTSSRDLAAAVSFASNEPISQVAAADVNGDGFADVVGLGSVLTVFANLASDCGRGTVNAGHGAPSDVLRADDSTGGRKRSHIVAANAPVEISLSASRSGPVSARYVLYAWNGWPEKPAPVGLGRRSIGCGVSPTPLVRPAEPQPAFCLASAGIPPVAIAQVRRLAGSPARAPWTLRRGGGFRHGTVFTLQGILEDEGSASPLGYSVTNALTLVVR